jgi:nicotinamidase-related amidase
MAEIMSAKLIESAVHLCVDMKRTFASGGIWETRRMKRVLPTVIGMTARYPERAIFTRYDAKLGREASVQW